MSQFVSDMFSLSMFLFDKVDNIIVLYCIGLIFINFCFGVVRRLMCR